jgi:hypothetical protein
MEALELIAANPELAGKIKFEATAADLLAFGEYIHRRAEEARPEPKAEEEYLTPQEFADALKISLVTLWHWDGKGITQPLRIGNKKRYRRSDLEKILTRG